ncbi:MAG: glycosyltransferase [Anaerolineae bacterium]|nr:glycosyltransferase [Anaerolineae bacterium]
MARILILTPQVPYPPRQGTALRNWGILRGLAAKHEVSLLTFATPDQPQEPPAAIKDIVSQVAIVPQPVRTTQERVIALLTDRRPDLALRLDSSAFREQTEAWLNQNTYDWVLVEGLELTPYLNLVWKHPAPPKVLFDDHNCEYLLQKRAFLSDIGNPRRWPGAVYSFIQWQRLRRFERAICQNADMVMAVSQADIDALHRVVPGINPLLLPNGITVSEYANYNEKLPLEKPTFVFTGTMDFRPNVDGILWFAQDVWPRIRAVLPNAHCYVVGRHPHPRLDSLRALPGFVITGSVPDTRPYINAATVYIVPLLVGGGTRLKILEASAMGKAIVSTGLGAEGFPEAGKSLLLADTAAEFADACIYLCQDTVARAECAARTYTFATSYDWNALLPRLLRHLA